MPKEQTPQPEQSPADSADSLPVFETDPVTDCDCPADRRFRAVPMLIPKKELFDEWKSKKKKREYVETVGVKHSFEIGFSSFGVFHALDKDD